MRNKSWFLIQTPGDYKKISEDFGISSLCAIAARNRGVPLSSFDEYFNISKDNLHDPSLMLNAGHLTDILIEKLSQNKKIRVIGDYDIDGVCATYILFDGLKKMGFDVSYAIPNRITDGYGLNIRLIDDCINDEIDTIITCDNGIAAIDEIAYAKKMGMTVLITDHHEIPHHFENNDKVYDLPPADCICDIKQDGETYPFPDICGAVIAWKIVLLLEKKLGIKINAYDYIELAGFATIGDVMKLQGENRTIASLGIEAMKHTRNLGLKALMEACKILGSELSDYHLGFRLGPCINAAGRLKSADIAIKLLCSESFEQASSIAEELSKLNVQRQTYTDDAVNMSEADPSINEDVVLVCYIPGVHESVAGIAAGRLREKYYKPVIFLTDSGELVKGSARSIPGYNMFEKLNECRELFIKFGGHEMAAGMSLKKENVDTLRRFLNENHGLNDDILTEKIKIDAAVPFSKLNTDNVESLNRLAPYGNGNERPIFAAKGCRVLSYSLMGKNMDHIRLTVSDASGTVINCVRFNTGVELYDALNNSKSKNIDIIFFPQINEYLGNKKIQLLLLDYRF